MDKDFWALKQKGKYTGIFDCLKNNGNTAYSFISEVMPLIKKFPNLDLLYYSDGAPSQYKNYKTFSNLCYHLQDYGIQAEWYFFATSHGKSPCDGIGCTVKRLVARASLQNTSYFFSQTHV